MTLYTQAAINIRKTWLLITVFLVIIIFIGWFFSYLFNQQWILLIAVILAISQSIISYWYSDQIILSSVKARGPITKNDNPELYRIVENLALTAGLPTPKIYIIDDEAPNAFTTGRDPRHAIICVTSGLLQKLDKVELEGVISHEFAHIGNRDILLGSIVVVLVGIISILSDWFIRSFYYRGRRNKNEEINSLIFILGLIVIFIAPLAATLIRLAISRRREFLADATGALITRYPEGLARALAKISADPNLLQNVSTASAHLFIVDPFKNHQNSWLYKIWQTHPPVQDRIEALLSIKLNNNK